MEDMMKLAKVKVTGGELYPYMKGVSLTGRIADESNNNFIVYGCPRKYEQSFYKGLLEYDKVTKIHGFESIEEVEECWISGLDGLFLVINNGEYEVEGSRT